VFGVKPSLVDPERVCRLTYVDYVRAQEGDRWTAKEPGDFSVRINPTA
jgi:hypothetical protein